MRKGLWVVFAVWFGIIVMPGWAQGEEFLVGAGPHTVMKCSMRHDIGTLVAHIRPIRPAGDADTCKCFYIHGQGEERFFAHSAAAGDIQLASCAVFCQSKLDLAKQKGASDQLIQRCKVPGNWK